MSHDEAARRRLAMAVDSARLELGLTKRELGLIARVARSTVSRLINDAVVPSRPATLDKIGGALGWAQGSCAAVLSGGSPVMRAVGAGGPAGRSAAALVAERLEAIAAEARTAAREADEQARRLRSLEDQARAAARLALGVGR